MPFNNEITIHPHDLQQIMSTLAIQCYLTGPVIIRDNGKQFVIRDINEQHIAKIDKTTIEEPG